MADKDDKAKKPEKSPRQQTTEQAVKAAKDDKKAARQARAVAISCTVPAPTTI